jgi:hypothetical protein
MHDKFSLGAGGVEGAEVGATYGPSDVYIVKKDPVVYP